MMYAPMLVPLAQTSRTQGGFRCSNAVDKAPGMEPGWRLRRVLGMCIRKVIGSIVRSARVRVNHRNCRVQTIGFAEFSFANFPVLQKNCETPQRWLRKGPYYWAVRNGGELRVGATSRIGFWLWFLVPVSSLLLGSVAAGALLYGTYAAARGLGVWAHFIRWPDWTRVPQDEFGTFLFRLNGRAKQISALLLVTMCAAAIVIVA